MDKPKHFFAISALNLKAGAITRHFISPTEAARLDPAAFAVFAAEVAKVAAKLKAGEVRQLELVEAV